MATDAMAPIGLAMPWPAMSGAEPCTGSNRPGPVADRGRGQEPERAGQHRRLVAQDVAEEVLGEQHVDRGGVGHQAHGRVVDVQVLEPHVGIVERHPGHRLPPEL